MTDQFIGATFLLGSVAFFLATYIYATNHEFYCEAQPKWQNWNSEWLFFGLVIGPFATSACIDWFCLMINNFLVRRGAQPPRPNIDERLLPTPIGLAIALAPMGLCVALVAAIPILLFAGLQWLFMGSFPSFPKSLMPKRKQRPSGDQRDLEMGNMATSDEAQHADREVDDAVGMVISQNERLLSPPFVDRPIVASGLAEPERAHTTFPHRKADVGLPPYAP